MRRSPTFSKLSADGRELKNKIEALGVIIDEWCLTGNRHIRWKLRRPDNKTMILVSSLTNGDHRGHKNALAIVKRWQRGDDV